MRPSEPPLRFACLAAGTVNDVTFEVDPKLRLVIVTGGPGAGKTTLCQGLYGGLPECWRLLPMDNFLGIALQNGLPEDLLEAIVKLTEVTLAHWKNDEGLRFLVDGVISSTTHVRRLSEAFGVTWPSMEVRVLQLVRTIDTHRRRRRAAATWDLLTPAGMTKDQAFAYLERLVPAPIPGTIEIKTDDRSRTQILEEALGHLA